MNGVQINVGVISVADDVPATGTDPAGTGRLGKYSDPVCPQPDKPTMHTTRTSALTKICFALNMVKL